jgi:phospholipase/lecithinase/hemolysin
MSLLLPSFSPASAKLSSLDKLFTFGDSSSDIGNGTILSLNHSGTTAFPAPPNVDGRASNGLLAHEYLWSLFNPTSPGLTPSLSGGTNYAISGTTTGVVNFNTISPVVPDNVKNSFIDHGGALKLEHFLPDKPTFNPSTSLFYIWAFPNDVLNWLTTAQLSGGNGLDSGTVTGLPPNTIGSDATSIALLVTNSVQNVETLITTLSNHGATQFLVPNMVDLGMTPLFRSNPNPGRAPMMSQLTSLYNTSLANMLHNLSATLPDIDIMEAKVDTLLGRVFRDPDFYGFENVTDSCLDIMTGDVCADPERWLFWDYFHPTTAVQRSFGYEYYNLASEVPAPLPLASLAVAFKLSRSLRARIRSGKVACK